MDVNELAKLMAPAVMREMTRLGMVFWHELAAKEGLVLDEDETALLESGVVAGVVAATNWYMDNGMLKDLEIKRGNR